MPVTWFTSLKCKISHGNHFCAEALNYSEAAPSGTGSAHYHCSRSERISNQVAWWKYLLTAEMQESVAEVALVENCASSLGK